MLHMPLSRKHVVSRLGIVLVLLLVPAIVESADETLAVSMTPHLDPIGVLFGSDSKPVFFYNTAGLTQLSGYRSESGPGIIVQHSIGEKAILSKFTSLEGIRATGVAKSDSTNNSALIVGEFERGVSFCRQGESLTSTPSSGRSAFWAEVDIKDEGGVCPTRQEILHPNIQGTHCAVRSPRITSTTFSVSTSATEVKKANLIVAQATECKLNEDLEFGQLGLIAGAPALTDNTGRLDFGVTLKSEGASWNIKALRAHTNEIWVGGEVLPTTNTLGASRFLLPEVNISNAGIWVALLSVTNGKVKAEKVFQFEGLELLDIAFQSSTAYAFYRQGNEIYTRRLSATVLLGEPSQLILKDAGTSFLGLSCFEISGPAEIGISASWTKTSNTITDSFSNIYTWDVSKDPEKIGDVTVSGMKVEASKVASLDGVSFVALSKARWTSDFGIHQIIASNSEPPLAVPAPFSPTAPPQPAQAAPAPSSAVPLVIPPIASNPITSTSPTPVSDPIASEPLYTGATMSTSTKWVIAALVFVVVSGLAYLGYRYWHGRQIAVAMAQARRESSQVEMDP